MYIFHIGPACSPALPAKVKPARLHIWKDRGKYGTLLTSEHEQSSIKRRDTRHRTLREKQASETARLRETGRERCAVFLRQQQRLTSDSREDNYIDKFKYESKLHHSLRLLFCWLAICGHA